MDDSYCKVQYALPSVAFGVVGLLSVLAAHFGSTTQTSGASHGSTGLCKARYCVAKAKGDVPRLTASKSEKTAQ